MWCFLAYLKYFVSNCNLIIFARIRLFFHVSKTATIVGDFERALLVDFEGEDGDVPKSLLRRIGKYANKRVGGVSQGLGKAMGGMVQMGGQMVSKVTKGGGGPGKLFDRKLGGGGVGDSGVMESNDDPPPPSPPSAASPAIATPPMSPANNLPPLEPLELSQQQKSGSHSSNSNSNSSSSSSNTGEAASPGLGSRSGLIGALEQLGDEWNYELW